MYVAPRCEEHYAETAENLNREGAVWFVIPAEDDVGAG